MRTGLIPLSVSAILVLAACGSDESVSSPTDPSLQPPVAVNVAGSGGGTAEAATMDAAAQDASAGSDDADKSTRLMPEFVGYVFEIGEGLPVLPTNSTGYHFPAGVGVDAAEVGRLADALGVAGNPEAAAADSGNQWRVGPEDGSAPALFVANDGQVSWYYSNAWATAEVAGCGVSGSEGATIDADATGGVAVDVDPQEPTIDTTNADQPISIGDCATPEPPAGVPTADEAVAKANELLTALGEDPAAFELETYADEWSASVTAYTTVDGMRWPIVLGFGFGAEGALQWANGSIAEPVASGPYPLIDVDAAIARLTEQNGMWGYGGVDVLTVDARGTEMTSGEVTSGGVTSGGVASGGVAPADQSVTPELKPGETPVDDGQTLPAPDDGSTTPPVEPLVSTLVDVKADLWWVWDADGSVWFLPAYTFTDTDGNTFTVPAVTDEFMIVVEPTVGTAVEPVPAEPVDPVVVGPPTTDAGVGVPADPSTDPTAPDATGLDALVGSSLQEFEKAALRYGFATRVARQDGVDLSVTMDYSDSRVNVAVKGDIVAEIISIG